MSGPVDGPTRAKELSAAHTAPSNSIGRITTSGVITSYPFVNSYETGPVAITSGPDGALCFANYGPSPFASIGRITTSGW